MNTLLEITKDQYSSVTIGGDNWLEMLAFGAKILLIGIGTVFAVLALIWGALTLFKIFFHDLPAKRAAQKKAEEPEAPAVQETVEETSDDELIAVLAAAIAAAEADAGGKKFRVVSFKRN